MSAPHQPFPLESGFDDEALAKPRYYVLPVEGCLADASEVCQSLTFEGLGFYCERVRARDDYWRFWLSPDALPWLERTGQLYNPHFG